MKELHCKSCNTYLGVCRDGKLHKDLVCLCQRCDNRRVADSMIVARMERARVYDFMDEINKALNKK